MGLVNMRAKLYQNLPLPSPPGTIRVPKPLLLHPTHGLHPLLVFHYGCRWEERLELRREAGRTRRWPWAGWVGMGWGGAARSSAMAEAVLPPARLSISHPKPRRPKAVPSPWQCLLSHGPAASPSPSGGGHGAAGLVSPHQACLPSLLLLLELPG